jgi:hypothetical protein
LCTAPYLIFSRSRARYPQKINPGLLSPPLHLEPNAFHLRNERGTSVLRRCKLGQETELAASPSIAAGSQNPLADLLFSARPAFIWDHARRCVSWMNAAARTAFGLSAQELQDALPAALIRRFAQCFEGAGKAPRIAKVKAGRQPAFDCSLDAIELAGGGQGLIVAKTGSENAVAASLPPRAPKPDAKAAAKKQPAKTPHKLAAVPQLTPEEMRSFKAIGRTVRRLAGEKCRVAAAPLPAPASAKPAQPAKAGSGAQTAANPLFAAFDLVLLLGENFEIAGVEGRPARLGHRKAALLGLPAAQLFLPSGQAPFRRMVRTLEGTAQTARGTLPVGDTAGNALPCRAILGHWGGGAKYFLALVSLAMPGQLKKPQAQPVHPPVARLAA